MIALFLRSMAAHFRSGRMLFLLTLLGVALGVASVLSIQIINRNALAAFEGSVRAVSGDSDLSVLGTMPTFGEDLYPRVLADPDVVSAWPIHRVHVAVSGRPDTFLEIVGFDLLQPVRIPWDEAPESAATPLDTPGWAAVSPPMAERLGLQAGDRLEVTLGSKREALTVGALVDFRRITPLAGSAMVVMDIAQAQARFGERGRIHQIDVRLREDASRSVVASRLAAALGPSVRVVTPQQRTAEASGLLGAFRLNLTALSLISLFVGGFLVYSSTQASLVRRRQEFGVLRSLGATRGQTTTLVLAEVGLLGVLGVAVGVPLGYLVAQRNVDVVSSTLTQLYLLEGIETLRLSPALFVLAATIGLLGALAGAIGPALEMSRTDTRALLAAYAVHERTEDAAGRLLLAGFGVLAAAGLLFLATTGSWKPAGFALGVGLLIGLPLMSPWVVREATRAMRCERFGLFYGVKALGLRLRTTAFAVAALAVAVSMLIGITLMIGSFRRTVEIWIGDTLQADVYVTSESWRRARQAAALDDGLIRALEAMPTVMRVDRLRQFFGYTGERRIAIGGTNVGEGTELSRVTLLEGPPDAMEQLRTEGAVIVSEPLARKIGVSAGGTIPVSTASGEHLFRVAAISYDYSSESGGILMALDTMEEVFGEGAVTNLALHLREGADPEQTVDAIRSAHPDAPLEIRSNRTIREEVFRIFDQTFAVTRLLQYMSLLIAACGITITLIVLARERISELALYRALGSTRARIFRVFLGKGLGIAVFGLALGAVGGLALAMILIFVINRAYFGWTIAVYWPWAEMLRQAVTILVAAVLASLYPAWRASRTPATELSRDNL